MDATNKKVFLLLCHEDFVGGLPLGLFMCSSERSKVIRRVLEMVAELAGKECFYGQGYPSVVMTDDSRAEQLAVTEIWPDAKQILCTFHVLQAYRRWLSAHLRQVISSNH